jgi:hypothetical protein
MEYKFSGEMTLDDYIQFNEVHFKKRFFIKLEYLFYFILLVMLILSFFSAFPKLARLEPGMLVQLITPKILLYIGLVALSIVLLIILNRSTPLIYKRYYNSNKMMSEPKEYYITENEIKITGESEKTIIKKDKINKIVFYNDAIYIYIALNMALIIKKRFLGDAYNFDDFSSFIRKNYDPRAE